MSRGARHSDEEISLDKQVDLVQSRRNPILPYSVKISVDHYHGSVAFYVSDSEDPVLRLHQRVFPNVSKKLA